MLDVQKLSVTFGGIPAVQEISFTVEPGRTIGLIGPNGAGKTTVLNALSGFVRASGSLRLNGHELQKLSPNKRARLGMARTFQQPQLFERQSIRDHLQVADDQSRNAGMSHEAAVALVGIDRRLDQPCDELNSHERVLVEIARALVTGPQIVLLDEPAAGLLPHEVDDLLEVSRRMHTHTELSILLVDHNMDLVLTAADHVHVLDFGRLLFSGSPHAVRNSKQVIDAYLGEA